MHQCQSGTSGILSPLVYTTSRCRFYQCQSGISGVLSPLICDEVDTDCISISLVCVESSVSDGISISLISVGPSVSDDISISLVSVGSSVSDGISMWYLCGPQSLIASISV